MTISAKSSSPAFAPKINARALKGAAVGVGLALSASGCAYLGGICGGNPCAGRKSSYAANPCAGKNPCSANPCASNPCASKNP
ncbi:MAG: hypothetical protein AAF986_04705, partial [Pseudomonadota bacterium]